MESVSGTDDKLEKPSLETLSATDKLEKQSLETLSVEMAKEPPHS